MFCRVTEVDVLLTGDWLQGTDETGDDRLSNSLLTLATIPTGYSSFPDRPFGTVNCIVNVSVNVFVELSVRIVGSLAVGDSERRVVDGVDITTLEQHVWFVWRVLGINNDVESQF